MEQGTQVLNSRGNRRGTNPNSRRNLTGGWKRNDHAKKQFSLTACVREKLLEPCPHDPSMTWREYLAYQWLENAVDNPTFFKELMERLEGRTVQAIAGPDGGPIPIKQDVKIVGPEVIKPALSALIECGVLQTCKN